MHKAEKFWNRVSKLHDKLAKDQAYKKTIKETIQYLKPNDTVLDYGCATGLYSIELAKNVKEIHGIDISSKMIEIANKKALKNTFFTKADLYEKFAPETFNVILAFNVLHFLEDEQKVMQRINQLLKPGGLFISVTPCLGEKGSFLGHLARFLRKIKIIPYLKRFEITELNKLISKNFTIIKTESLNPLQHLIVSKKT